MIDTYHLPEIDTHYQHTPNLPDYEDLVLTPEDDAKLTHAAQRGHRAVTMGLAGDPDALAEMRRLHVTLWQHDRRET